MKIQPWAHLSDEQLKTRSGFDCGKVELNSYLAQTAAQHDRRNITRTFCALIDEAIVGYHCLANAEVDISAVGADVIKRHRLPRHRLPVVRLCRLAVDLHHHKKGIGGSLLAHALSRVLAVASDSGCVGMMVDAMDAEAARFYKAFGFHQAPENRLLFFLPLPEIEALLDS